MPWSMVRVERKELDIPEGRPIEIRVGPSRRVFYIHEQTLRARSKFFDAAMSNDWKESRERVVNLPKDDPDVFALYVFWIYRNQLATRTGGWGTGDGTEYMTLAKLYVLGERLQDVSLKNTAVDAILDKYWCEGNPILDAPLARSLVRYLYNNTLSSSPVRRLLVDICLQCGDSEWLSTWTRKDVTKDFLIDLSTVLLRQRSWEDTYGEWAPGDLADNCKYHEHVKDIPCSYSSTND